jgi:hypothetical protein
MGPTCEVLLRSDEPSVLDTIDAFLESTSDQIERTRKGRAWDLRIDGRSIHVQVVASPPAIELSAGCNDAKDYAVLRQVAERLAAACGGVATEPTK